MGTQNLKDVIVLVLRMHQRITDAKKDGKITFWETLSLGASSLPDLMSAVEGGNLIWEEIKDITEEELKELYAAVAVEFPGININGPVAGQDLVLMVYSWIVSTINVYNTISSLVSKPTPK